MKKIISGKSKVEGDGIFAGEDIKKGEFILYMKGKRIFFEYDNNKNYEMCSKWCGLKKNLWIEPEYPIVQTNHSCNPNMGMTGMVTFRAIRNIKKGDELTFDYSICEEELDWEMNCSCGSSNCRKVIRSIQFLPKKIFESYLPYIPKYFRKVYYKYNKIT
jgi:uncharacterized protein